jgi:hypothetical protein
MVNGRFDAWTRRRVGVGLGGLAAGLLGAAGGGETLARKKKKKKNPCAGKNVCMDRSHTCAGGNKLCYVKAFGGNVCALNVSSVVSCDACSSFPGTVCALSQGCGDSLRCVQP